MKRENLLLLLLLGFAWCALVGVRLSKQNHHYPCQIEPAALERIKRGDPLEQVIAIVGRPPGDYRSDASVDYLFAQSGPVPTPCDSELQWLTNHFALKICFDGDQKATRIRLGKGFGAPRWPERFWNRIRDF